MVLLAALVLVAPPVIVRDGYGVPTITADSSAAAWRAAGFAVAEDRMWQLENSRRLARGRMAAAFGPRFLASDREVLATAYTDEELDGQYARLPDGLRVAFAAYADGVNDFLQAGRLPAGYANYGLRPEPWTTRDSVAIAVRLLQFFGRGGAGELRNLAILRYLEARPNLKGHVLDVMDDLAWANDPFAPTTLAREEESRGGPKFDTASRATTERQLAAMPPASLFQLIGAVRLTERPVSQRLAQLTGAPFKTGSYCMVVNGKRSRTGRPVLLSAPQMGFANPSPVHEMSLRAPGLRVTGMDVPGIPAILIGHTPSLAWGITSGVADTDDIVYAPKSQATSISFRVPVKGAADEQVVQARLPDGPVLLTTSDTVWARRNSYRGRELESLIAITDLTRARTAEDADRCFIRGTMSFNAFYATAEGDIGWRYTGLVPHRGGDFDARFPTPASATSPPNLGPDDMPHVRNPRAGLLTNWNNKPSHGWPNWDTPVWGAIHGVDVIRRHLTGPKLGANDFQIAAWSIAREDETFGALSSPNDFPGFDGRLVNGSLPAGRYRAFVDALRSVLFDPSLGNFVSPDYARLILQPSLMARALQGRTKFNYLAGRTARQVVSAAIARAKAAPFKASEIAVPGQAAIPYRNRGTFTQIVSFGPDGPSGRSVLIPGNAQTGPHSSDQAWLGHEWAYKAMAPVRP